MWFTSNIGRGLVRTLVFIITDPFMLFYGISWTLVRITRYYSVEIPFVNNWLTDFVYVPLICGFAQWLFLNIIAVPERTTKFPLIQIMILAGIVSVVFEWVMPIYTVYNVADILDVVCYFLGGFFYYYVHQNYILKEYS